MIQSTTVKGAVVLFVGALLTFFAYTNYENRTPIASKPEIKQYGLVEVHVGETAIFPDNSVKLLRVFGESRCPMDVMCIQMGTVRVELESVSGLGTSNQTLELGKSFTTEGEEITFTKALPYPMVDTVILPGDYSITLDVKKKTVTQEEPKQGGGCYVGGCSGQSCSDRNDIVSTCEYRESYSCFKGATCERQSNGKCGWTKTNELEMCLRNTEGQ